MNVDDLTDEAVERYLGQMCAIALHKTDPEQKRDLLQALTDQFDLMDSDDGFGTEGWRHRFGISE